MNQERILQHLGGHPWSQSLIVYDEVTSTNTLLKTMGQQNAPEGTVLIADRQSAGRGRLGRSFLSPGGVGLYLSLLIRPHTPPKDLMHLTCAVAVAICDAVEAVAGIRPGVKWINDLVIGKRKLGGILTELAIDPKTQLVDYAVIGVGINCNQVSSDFDDSIRSMATSLKQATGNEPDRNGLAAEIIRSLHRMNAELLDKKDEIMEQYALDCITIGQDIQVIQGDTIRCGKAMGIDRDGGLIVADENGEIRTVSSGEVSVRGMYGYV